MAELKPNRLSKEQIWEEAESFREKYVLPPDTVPVPIDEIVEFDMNIQPQPIPNLKSEHDIDGFLVFIRDTPVIYIDQNIYENERQENRRRFTYAHESGHFWLHIDRIKAVKDEFNLDSPRDWIEFRANIPEDDLGWFEWQAYEFAGRLLVPRNRLIQELNSCSDKVSAFRNVFPNGDDEQLIDYLAGAINQVFRVAEKTIVKRIRHEKIWNLLSFNS